MSTFLFNLKIKTFKIFIPFLVKLKAFNILSFLFILSLSKLKSISTKKKSKFKIIILSKSGGIDDITESKAKSKDGIEYLACPRIFLTTIFITIFDDNEYHSTKKFYSKKQN